MGGLEIESGKGLEQVFSAKDSVYPLGYCRGCQKQGQARALEGECVLGIGKKKASENLMGKICENRAPLLS